MKGSRAIFIPRSSCLSTSGANQDPRPARPDAAHVHEGRLVDDSTKSMTVSRSVGITMMPLTSPTIRPKAKDDAGMDRQTPMPENGGDAHGARRHHRTHRDIQLSGNHQEIGGDRNHAECRGVVQPALGCSSRQAARAATGASLARRIGRPLAAAGQATNIHSNSGMAVTGAVSCGGVATPRQKQQAGE